MDKTLVFDSDKDRNARVADDRFRERSVRRFDQRLKGQRLDAWFKKNWWIVITAILVAGTAAYGVLRIHGTIEANRIGPPPESLKAF